MYNQGRLKVFHIGTQKLIDKCFKLLNGGDEGPDEKKNKNLICSDEFVIWSDELAICSEKVGFVRTN